MSESLPLATVKARFSELVDRVASQDDRVVVTRRGQPAVIISPDDLEALEETLAILSDPDLAARVRAGAEETARGELLSLDEVKSELRIRRPEG